MAKQLFLLGTTAVLTLVLIFCGCGEKQKNPLGTATSTSQTLDEFTPLGGQAGTTLTTLKTAVGFWEKTLSYDWSLTKSVEPTSVQICNGETGTVSYILTATRTLASEADVYIVRGSITVTNGGDRTTENLKLVDQVEYKTGAGQFQPLPGAVQTITPASQLGPGVTGSYDYEIAFVPIPEATYRNTVKITITNHSGHLGEEFGPEPKADFTLPSEPTLKYVDDKASVMDILGSLEGFTITSSSSGPWQLENSATINYTTSIANLAAMCDTYYSLANTATLTENTTATTRTASATLSIYTCECNSGCTLTIGFWKTHAGFTGRNPDRVSQYLPISLGSLQVTSASQAVAILNFNGLASNGINKLNAQLLAAKLNIANGANGSAVAATIAASDAFLLTFNSTSWNSLTKTQKTKVLNWMTTLDDYNNGLIGPGHCN